MSIPQTFTIPDHSVELKAIREELSSLRQLVQKAVIVPKPEWMTLKEYAAYIDKSTTTVRRLVLSGQVESKRLGKTLMIKV